MYVILTCLFELLWIYGFSAAENCFHFLLIAIIILTDFYFLEKACETIQTGTVYAVFSAVGTICTALMDTLLFQVEFSMAKGLFIALLILGVISLKLAENGVSGTEKDPKMGWISDFVASALEILGVVGLKLFSRRKSLFNLALFSGGFALSYLFLYFSLAYLDMSIAYAAWMGLGTAGAVIINMVFLGESRKMSRIIGVGLIVIGVVGLKMVS